MSLKYATPTGYSHCTFATILFQFFFAKLTFNLPVQMSTSPNLHPDSGIGELNFKRTAQLSQSDSVRIHLESSLHNCRANLPSGLHPLRFFSSTHFNLCVLVTQRIQRLLVSGLHAYLRRAGNYMSPLEHCPFLFSIDGILLVLFEHDVDPCES